MNGLRLLRNHSPIQVRLLSRSSSIHSSSSSRSPALFIHSPLQHRRPPIAVSFQHRRGLAATMAEGSPSAGKQQQQQQQQKHGLPPPPPPPPPPVGPSSSMRMLRIVGVLVAGVAGGVGGLYWYLSRGWREYPEGVRHWMREGLKFVALDDFPSAEACFREAIMLTEQVPPPPHYILPRFSTRIVLRCAAMCCDVSVCGIESFFSTLLSGPRRSGLWSHASACRSPPGGASQGVLAAEKVR